MSGGEQSHWVTVLGYLQVHLKDAVPTGEVGPPAYGT